jgi:Tfp pilus assembly protein PilX
MNPCDARAADQQGGSLVVALTLLVAMSIAALALARMVSTDLLLAGNAAFREAAVLASDAGPEAAIAWLTVQSSMTTANLLSDQPELGYYASVPDGLLVTGAAATGTNLTVGIDWDDDHCAGRSVTRCLSAAPALPLDDAGNSLRFVIHRMCRQAGASQAGGNSCLSWQPAQGAGGSRGQLGYGAALRLLPGERVYYRVTTRVRGPRNTTVFTQVLVHL